jgi:hypothetical protein
VVSTPRTRAAFAIVGVGAPLEWTPHLRFSVALIGTLTVGWGIICLALFMAAHRLGGEPGSVWRLATIGMIVRFVIDSALSVATGFWMNAVSNAGMTAGYLVPVLEMGAMHVSAPAAEWHGSRRRGGVPFRRRNGSSAAHAVMDIRIHHRPVSTVPARAVPGQ